MSIVPFILHRSSARREAESRDSDERRKARELEAQRRQTQISADLFGCVATNCTFISDIATLPAKATDAADEHDAGLPPLVQ